MDVKLLKDSADACRAEDKTGLDKVGEVIGVISNIAGVLSLPSTLISLVSVIDSLFGGGTPDPIKQQLDRIENLLQATFSFNVADASFTQMHRVNDAVVQCRSALQALLQEQPPYSTEALQNAQLITLTQTNLLESPPFWKRVFFEELLYVDYWFGRVAPPGEDIVNERPGLTTTFDYRLTLLGYLDALAVRTATLLLLLKSEFLQRDKVIEELRGRTAALEDFFNRILSGFVPARTPSLSQITYFLAQRPAENGVVNVIGPTSAFEPVPEFALHPIRVPRVVGVIQAHDGAGIADTYPLDLFPNRDLGPVVGGPAMDSEGQDFQARYALSVRNRRKRLYAEIGLPHAWTAIQDLRRVTGDPVETFDPRLYWSMRDILTDLGSAQDSGVPVPVVSLLLTARRLRAIAKFDTFPILSLRTSLQDALV